MFSPAIDVGDDTDTEHDDSIDRINSLDMQNKIKEIRNGHKNIYCRDVEWKENFKLVQQ